MTSTNYPLTLFFDSSCPMCNAEITSLRRRDVLGRLRFVDAAGADFVVPPGFTRDAMLAAIHGVTVHGRWVVGVGALRLAYAAVGLGWLAAPTAWPWLRDPAERAYRWFARNRHAMPRWIAPALVSLYAPRGQRRLDALRREADEAARRARCTETACVR